ncbi:lytic transglycosylase domain-containing protein [Pseudomonas aeruginosa]|uniref:transglycosylase SLT domain-containing protein n=1 Tax=Pseudomonas aeruginosa TaxID=287 RepID=UPI00229BB181|nr:lytic transglycosylase domain-containing protein [Pseudomonas aeruginosa]MCO2762504.1 lytic transglycosylase domain-containing protein [Pseudomonas aeruginosa]MCO2767707.1 lytic transglycosylase domain-containing protein [Pseudomonas aeruginosa]HBN9243620.1 transglycosylase SLT domain-containing protein [Pseudomonas aeruginosa]HCH0556067.1 transglycosylase SLT domain-containing protein [Pseudomonas aeruginosa]
MFKVWFGSLIATSASIAVCVSMDATANEFSLRGTMWERASMASVCKPDPLLLYSLALNESRSSAGEGMVAPHPFALRNATSGALYPNTYKDAKAVLGKYIAEDILTDIGIMQINYRWNGKRVERPELLLDPEVNIRIGAQILCESIAQYPTDMQLAIGGYHTRNPRRELDARQYASNVLSIWRSLQRLK